MRINHNVATSSTLSDNACEQSPIVKLSSEKGTKGLGIEFGTSEKTSSVAPNYAQTVGWGGQPESLSSLLKKGEQLQQENMKKLASLLQSSFRRQLASISSKGVTATQSVTSTTASTAVSDVKGTDPATLAAIDNSQFSRADELKRWDSMVDHLPESERVAAEKVLNRPYAAAKLALEGTDEQKAKAREYINANQALFTAIETRAGAGDNRHVMADGSLSDKDLKVFAGTMKEGANQANMNSTVSYIIFF